MPQRFLGTLQGQRNPLAEILRGAREGVDAYQQGLQQRQQMDMARTQQEQLQQQMQHASELLPYEQRAMQAQEALTEAQAGLTGTQQQQMLQEIEHTEGIHPLQTALTEVELQRAEFDLDAAKTEQDREQAHRILQGAMEVAGSPQFKDYEQQILSDQRSRELLQEFYPGFISTDEERGMSFNIGDPGIISESDLYVTKLTAGGELEHIMIPDEIRDIDPRFREHRIDELGNLQVIDTISGEIVHEQTSDLQQPIMSVMSVYNEDGTVDQVPVTTGGEVLWDSAITGVSPELESLYMDEEIRTRQLDLRETEIENQVTRFMKEMDWNREQAETAVEQFREQLQLERSRHEFQTDQWADQYGLERDQLRQAAEQWAREMALGEDQFEESISQFNEQHGLERERWQDELAHRYAQLDQNRDMFMKEFGLEEKQMDRMFELQQEEMGLRWEKFGASQEQAAFNMWLQERELEQAETRIGQQARQLGIQEDKLRLEAGNLRNIRIQRDPDTNEIITATADRFNPDKGEYEENVDLGDHIPYEALPAVTQYQMAQLQAEEASKSVASLDPQGLASMVSTTVMTELQGTSPEMSLGSPHPWRTAMGEIVTQKITNDPEFGPEDRDKLEGQVVAELERRGNIVLDAEHYLVEPRELLSQEGYEAFQEARGTDLPDRGTEGLGGSERALLQSLVESGDIDEETASRIIEERTTEPEPTIQPQTGIGSLLGDIFAGLGHPEMQGRIAEAEQTIDIEAEQPMSQWFEDIGRATEAVLGTQRPGGQLVPGSFMGVPVSQPPQTPDLGGMLQQLRALGTEPGTGETIGEPTGDPRAGTIPREDIQQPNLLVALMQLLQGGSPDVDITTGAQTQQPQGTAAITQQILGGR